MKDPGEDPKPLSSGLREETMPSSNRVIIFDTTLRQRPELGRSPGIRAAGCAVLGSSRASIDDVEWLM